jgi:hypothetical protein
MKIWLDDVRNAPDETWLWVRDFDEAQSALNKYRGKVELMSFDHDLGLVEDGLFLDYADSGYDLLCWIEKMAAKGKWQFVPARMQIHSANPVGRKNMQAAIDSIERMRSNGLD